MPRARRRESERPAPRRLRGSGCARSDGRSGARLHQLRQWHVEPASSMIGPEWRPHVNKNTPIRQDQGFTNSIARASVGASFSGGVAEWLKAAVLKTAFPKGDGGSNPSSSARECVGFDNKGSVERWPRGRRRRFAKPLYGAETSYRGFESPPIRRAVE